MWNNWFVWLEHDQGNLRWFVYGVCWGATTKKADTRVDPHLARYIMKEAAHKKLAEGKRSTVGLPMFTEGHHVGQFALDIIKKTHEN
jgi:hypothetical protein